jgi:hypothetical protein
MKAAAISPHSLVPTSARRLFRLYVPRKDIGTTFVNHGIVIQLPHFLDMVNKL